MLIKAREAKDDDLRDVRFMHHKDDGIIYVVTKTGATKIEIMWFSPTAGKQTMVFDRERVYKNINDNTWILC